MDNAKSILIQEGINEKKNGNFEKSLEYYLKAVEIDPTYKATYNGIGKTAYLMGDISLSVLSYLCYMHLEMNELERKIVNGSLPMPFEGMYNDLPEQMKEVLPRKSAVLIFYDRNIQKHIGHAITDRHPERPESLDGLVNIYSAQIQGKPGYNYSHLYDEAFLTPGRMNQIEEEVYLPRGLQVMVDLIQWDQILDSNVLDIYFNKENPIL